MSVFLIEFAVFIRDLWSLLTNDLKKYKEDIMDDRQDNNLRKYNGITAFWAGKSSITTSIETFATVLTGFTTLVKAIEIKGKIQQTDITQYTAIKQAAREKLIDLTNLVIAGIRLLDPALLDAELQGIGNITKTKLMTLREGQLRTFTQKIMEKIPSLKTELVKYGISEAMITEFEAGITSYVTTIDEASGGESGRKAATTTLPNLFKEADTYLTKFDSYITILSRSNPDLQAEWETVRNIKNYGIRHEAAETVAATDTTEK